MNKNLIKNSLFTLIANLSLAISNWLLLIIIAKQFTNVFLGEFVLALSVTTPIFLFFSFKMRTIIIVNTDKTFTTEQILNARLLANFCAMLLSLSIGYIFFPGIPFIIFILLSVYKWCDSWSELSYSYFHKFNLFYFVSISQSSRALSSIFILLLVSYTSTSAVLTITLWVLVTSIFAYFDIKKIFRHSLVVQSKPIELSKIMTTRDLYHSSLKFYKKHFTLSVSLVIGSLFIYIPNFFIERELGISATGQFATISYFLIAGSLIITSISQAALPNLTNIISISSPHKFYKLTIQLCLSGGFIGVVGLTVAIIGGPLILTLFYNSEIATKHTELIWIMAAAAIKYIYIFIGTAMNALKLFHLQTKIYIAGSITLLICCIYYVPIEGTIGAAKSMFLATCLELVLFIFTFTYNYKNNGIRIHD